MPTYGYCCDVCGHAAEEFRKLSDGHPPRCPRCGAAWGDGWRQDLTGLCGATIAYGEPTTFGQQAELNARRLGREQLRMLEERHAQRAPWQGPVPRGASPVPAQPEPPWFRSGDVPGLERMSAPLDLASVRNVEEYVMTGKK